MISVWGVAFTVWGSGCGVWGLGVGGQGLSCTGQRLRSGVWAAWADGRLEAEDVRAVSIAFFMHWRSQEFVATCGINQGNGNRRVALPEIISNLSHTK